MFKKIALLTIMFFSISSYAADTVVNGQVWAVEHNTGSSFYSAMEGKQEITMECLLGDITFGMHDEATGVDINSHDNRVSVVIDEVVYKAPVTLQERADFYETVLHGKNSFQLRAANGVQSKVYPIKELRSMFKSIEFELSNCSE